MAGAARREKRRKEALSAVDSDQENFAGAEHGRCRSVCTSPTEKNVARHRKAKVVTFIV
jgi:hypothetical protein